MRRPARRSRSPSRAGPRVLHAARGGEDDRRGRAAVARPVLTGTAADIPALQRAVRDGRADLRPALAAAYLQRARETARPLASTRAPRACSARPRTPEALGDGGRARAGPPRLPRRAGARCARRARAARAIRVDALVELGRYDAAERELQAMVDRKPNLAGYARVSYLRELRGDLDGAVAAMRLAVAAGGPAAENGAYVGALLGELERRRGRAAAARPRVRARTGARARPRGRRGRARAARRAARARGDRAPASRSSRACRCPST